MGAVFTGSALLATGFGVDLMTPGGGSAPDAAGAMSHLDDLGDLDRAFVGEDRATLRHFDRLVDG